MSGAVARDYERLAPGGRATAPNSNTSASMHTHHNRAEDEHTRATTNASTG